MKEWNSVHEQVNNQGAQRLFIHISCPEGFLNSGTFPDTRKVVLKVHARRIAFLVSEMVSEFKKIHSILLDKNVNENSLGYRNQACKRKSLNVLRRIVHRYWKLWLNFVRFYLNTIYLFIVKSVDVNFRCWNLWWIFFFDFNKL